MKGLNELKIVQREFSNKAFEVKASNKNMRKCYEVQLIMAKAEDIESLEPVEQIQRTLDMTNEIVDFVADILKLDDKQKEKLDDMESVETIKVANHIVMRLMGLTEAQIKDVNEKQEEPEKNNSSSISF